VRGGKKPDEDTNNDRIRNTSRRESEYESTCDELLEGDVGYFSENIALPEREHSLAWVEDREPLRAPATRAYGVVESGKDDQQNEGEGEIADERDARKECVYFSREDGRHEHRPCTEIEKGPDRRIGEGEFEELLKKLKVESSRNCRDKDEAANRDKEGQDCWKHRSRIAYAVFSWRQGDGFHFPV